VLFHVGTSFVQFGPIEWGRPYLWDEVARRFPDLRMVLAHVGHPWEGECIAVIRKHPHVYADVSALCYRPWQFYNSMRLAEEYGVQHKLLFGTDYPFTTPDSAMAGIRAVNRVCEGTQMPRVSLPALEEMLHRDAVKLLWA
jgi:predicted TIM-barrel fold metal-dependent hydrolase